MDVSYWTTNYTTKLIQNIDILLIEMYRLYTHLKYICILRYNIDII
jgi:hypothetical protein